MSPGTRTYGSSPSSLALRLTAIYAVIGGLWIIFSDRLLAALQLPIGLERGISSAKGEIYVVVTSAALYVLTLGMLRSLRAAQDAVREQDQRIRQAYVDVIDAATGGKLVLCTPAEIEAGRGTPLTQPRAISEGSELAEARRFVRTIISGSLSLDSIDNALLAFGEALSNALKHAGPAVYQVLLADDGLVQLVVTDTGPGIDFRTLPKATLFPGFSTARTLGMGFTIMLQTSERVLISTGEGGTRIVLEIR